MYSKVYADGLGTGMDDISKTIEETLTNGMIQDLWDASHWGYTNHKDYVLLYKMFDDKRIIWLNVNKQIEWAMWDIYGWRREDSGIYI